MAKRLDTRFEPSQRSRVWLKMRINQGQELVIGGYISMLCLLWVCSTLADEAACKSLS